MQSDQVLRESSRKGGGALLRALSIALLFGLFVGGLMVLRWANRPVPTVALPRQEFPADNAYEDWVKALNRITPLPRQTTLRRPFEAPLETLRPLVTADLQDLAEIRRIVRRPIVRPRLAPVPLPRAHDACLLMTAQSRLLCAEGRPAEAVDIALDAVQHTATVGRVVECLFGCSWMEPAWIAARSCVPELDSGKARSAGQRVELLAETFPTWADEVAQLRLDSLLRAHDALATPKSFAKLLELGDPDGGIGSLRNQLVWTFYPKANGYEELAGWWDRVEAESRKPFHQRGRSFFTRSIVGRKVEPGLVTDVAPTLALARLRMLRLELALREAYVAHQRYPATLEELKPRFLREVPTDPFNDQPFHYRPTKGGYTLYSVGPNLFDEEGTPFKDQSLSRQSAGDLVVTRP